MFPNPWGFPFDMGERRRRRRSLYSRSRDRRRRRDRGRSRRSRTGESSCAESGICLATGAAERPVGVGPQVLTIIRVFLKISFALFVRCLFLLRSFNLLGSYLLDITVGILRFSAQMERARGSFAMVFSLLLLHCFFLEFLALHSTGFDFTRSPMESQHEPPGSQFPGRATGVDFAGLYRSRVEPRVGLCTMSRSGAVASLPASAKQHGSHPFDNAFSRHSKNTGRKRAFRRACERMRRSPFGGTWHRGRWVTAAESQHGKPRVFLGRPHNGTVATVPKRDPHTRLSFMSYNIGGMGTDCYDAFANWLQNQTHAMVVVLQEIHWGLGKEDTCFQIGSWSVMTCVDPNQRLSGVAVCVSSKLVPFSELRFATIVPGRLMHVRCLRHDFNVDIVGMYQWAWNTQHVSLTEQRRHRVWTSAGRLLSQLPRRNILLWCCDANTPVVPKQSYVGKGVIKSQHTQTDVDEFIELIASRDLCVLNSWKSSRRSVAGTYVGTDVCTQIDFLISRRSLTDLQSRQARPLDLDLTPWRHGAKHRPVCGCVPFRGDWQKPLHKPAQKLRYDKQSLDNLLTTCEATKATFCSRVEAELQRLPQAEPSAINSAILKICAEMFPPKSSRVEAVARAWETGCVQTSLRDMWHRFGAMKQIASTRLPGSRSLRDFFAQWRTACRAPLAAEH